MRLMLFNLSINHQGNLIQFERIHRTAVRLFSILRGFGNVKHI